MGIRVLGTGAYLPPKIVTNADLAKIVDTSDEWILSRTGIEGRHVETELLTWQMGVEAAKKAIASSGIAPDEIDLVICSTVTGDYLTPSAACMIANALGLPKPFCFDISSACAGFVAAVDIAEHYMRDSAYQTALIVSSEMLTKMVDYTDRSTCILFGDGAGAVVLQRADAPYYSVTGSDPSGVPHLFARGIAPNEQFRTAAFDWASDGMAETKGNGLYQDGRDVYKFATRILPAAVRQVCEDAGIQPEELAMIFPHQANLRIIETAAKNIGLPLQRFFVNIRDHGNISSACIPICLAEAEEQGLLHRGDKICIVGFGAGLVYAASLFEW